MSIGKQATRAMDALVRAVDSVVYNRLAFWSGMVFITILNALPDHGWDWLWTTLGVVASASALGAVTGLWEIYRINSAMRRLDAKLNDPNWDHRIIVLPPKDLK